MHSFCIYLHKKVLDKLWTILWTMCITFLKIRKIGVPNVNKIVNNCGNRFELWITLFLLSFYAVYT